MSVIKSEVWTTIQIKSINWLRLLCSVFYARLLPIPCHAATFDCEFSFETRTCASTNFDQQPSIKRTNFNQTFPIPTNLWLQYNNTNHQPIKRIENEMNNSDDLLIMGWKSIGIGIRVELSGHVYGVDELFSGHT